MNEEKQPEYYLPKRKYPVFGEEPDIDYPVLPDIDQDLKQRIMTMAKAHFSKTVNPLFDEDPTINISDSCLKAVTKDLWIEDDKSMINKIKAIARNESLLAQHVADLENQKKVDLHSTMDANIWTDEFLKSFPNSYLDRESVHAWVCNMIMVGYDHAHSKRDKAYVYILQSHAGPNIKVFHYEPSVVEMNTAYSTYLNDISIKPSDVNSEMNCVLYRWSREYGLQAWNGRIQPKDSRYEWVVANP